MELQKPTVLDAARIASELARLRDVRIEQVAADPQSHKVWLTLQQHQSNLVFVAEPRYCYLGYSEVSPSEHARPVHASKGFTIIGAEHVAGDRIAALLLTREDRLGRSESYRLIFELIPNKGNVILIDEASVIKWALKKKDDRTYQPPSPLKKPTALNFSIERLEPQPADMTELLGHLYGFNARDQINIEAKSYTDINDMATAISQYAREAVSPGPAWLIYQAELLAGYSLVKPHLLENEHAVKIISALDMYEQYYTAAVGQKQTEDKLESLRKVLDRELRIHRSKLAAIEKELETAEGRDTFRQYGELLLANIDNLERGMSGATLKNFEGQTPEYLTIPLNPARSISSNAEEYFAKYKKAASSRKALEKRYQASKDRLEQLSRIAARAEDDADSLEIELQRLHLISHQSKPLPRKVVAPRLPYKKFVASNGWEILVGRTNADNDELTFKVANKDDYWFHAWQAAGSHTVLRLPNKQAIPDKNILLEAAALAAHFSKARASSKVPVAYTQVRHVRKPRNFPPGKVMVEREKQLMVKPANPDDFLPKSEELL